MTAVTLIGIERNALPRKPNGVECDDCGKTASFDRRLYTAAIAKLRNEGWSIDERTGAASCGCKK